jgi:hypothetical protein
VSLRACFWRTSDLNVLARYIQLLDGAWQELGRTEIAHGSSPAWVQRIQLTYHFEQVRVLISLRPRSLTHALILDASTAVCSL